jgi:hypothetical protein
VPAAGDDVTIVGWGNAIYTNGVKAKSLHVECTTANGLFLNSPSAQFDVGTLTAVSGIITIPTTAQIGHMIHQSGVEVLFADDDPPTSVAQLEKLEWSGTGGMDKDNMWWVHHRPTVRVENELTIGANTGPTVVLLVDLQNAGEGAWNGMNLGWSGAIKNLSGANFTLGATGDLLGDNSFINRGILTVRPNAVRKFVLGDGEFKQTPVASTQYDWIDSHTLNLAGTLNVTLLSGYSVHEGDVFTIMTGGRTGVFDDVNLPTLPDGLRFRVVYESNAVLLKVDKVRIIITDKDGNEFDPAKGMKVAKWSDAFRQVDETVQIKGPDANGWDFIDRDPDRFNVRVYDPAAWDVGTQTIDVTISTTNEAEYTAYDDPTTTLRLVRMVAPGWTNWFWSDSQILVSNEADDKYTDANIGADESGPAVATNNKNGSAFPVTDRTHRIALGGTVKVKYVLADMPAVTDEDKVLVRKQVKINVTIVRTTANGSAPITEEDAKKEIKRANEQYAQVGIRLVTIGVKTENPPTGVILDGGFETIGLDGYQNATQTAIPMTNEEKALFDKAEFRTTATDDIELYFVNLINTGSAGQSYWASGVPDQKYADSVVISVLGLKGTNNPQGTNINPSPFTVAHEIGHILLNSGDHWEVGVKKVNLMRSPTSSSDSEFATKRLLLEQEETMLGKPGKLPARPNLLGY